MVDELGLPPPQVGRLETISASRAFDLTSCGLRVAWVRANGVVSANPSAALGSASHQLVASVYKGEFDEVPESELDEKLRAALDRAITEAYQMQHQLFGASSLPTPRRWRNLQRSRYQLTSAMQREVLRRIRGEAEQVLLVEKKLWSNDGRIEGKPDRIDVTPSGHRVVDFKTGWDGSGDIPARFRYQLLIYAYLWQQTEGTWPSEAGLQAIDGQVTTMPVIPSEVEHVVEAVRASMDAINGAIESGVHPTGLASASDVACSFCPWRPRCAAYFRDRGPTNESSGAALIGDVSSIEESKGSVAITLSVVAGRPDIPPGQVRLIDVPFHVGAKPGDRLSVVDVRPTGHGAQFRWQTWTSWWRVDSATVG